MTKRVKVIALITDNHKIEEACRAASAPFDELRIEKLTSVEAFRREVTSGHWWGLLIDIRSLMHATAAERLLVDELNDYLPVGKMHWNVDLGKVEGTADALMSLTGDFLPGFFSQIHREDAQRAIRRFLRRRLYLNVQLHVGKSSFCCNTYNVSEGGAFLIHPDPVAPGTVLTLEAQELAPSPGITAEVRWSLPWGKSRHHPAGMGVKFQGLRNEQLAMLRAL